MSMQNRNNGRFHGDLEKLSLVKYVCQLAGGGGY